MEKLQSLDKVAPEVQELCQLAANQESWLAQLMDLHTRRLSVSARQAPVSNTTPNVKTVRAIDITQESQQVLLSLDLVNSCMNSMQSLIVRQREAMIEC